MSTKKKSVKQSEIKTEEKKPVAAVEVKKAEEPSEEEKLRSAATELNEVLFKGEKKLFVGKKRGIDGLRRDIVEAATELTDDDTVTDETRALIAELESSSHKFATKGKRKENAEEKFDEKRKGKAEGKEEGKKSTTMSSLFFESIKSPKTMSQIKEEKWNINKGTFYNLFNKRTKEGKAKKDKDGKMVKCK